MAQRISARLTSSEGRKFGLSVGGAFVVLAAILWWRASRGAGFTADLPWGGRRALAAVFATLGASVALAGLAIPTALGPVQRGWMRLALAISKVTTPIVMSVVYFVVIAPIGVAMRLFGKNPLRHVSEGESAWITRPARRSDLRRQF